MILLLSMIIFIVYDGHYRYKSLSYLLGEKSDVDVIIVKQYKKDETGRDYTFPDCYKINLTKEQEEMFLDILFSIKFKRKLAFWESNTIGLEYFEIILESKEENIFYEISVPNRYLQINIINKSNDRNTNFEIDEESRQKLNDLFDMKYDEKLLFTL